MGGDVDGGVVGRHWIVEDVVEDVIKEVGEGETDGVVRIAVNGGGGVDGDTGHQQIESVEENDTLGKGDAGVVEGTHSQGDGDVLGSGREERAAREGAARARVGALLFTLLFTCEQ
jgi:hypothetical protein